jgi:hypothetical protein
MDRGKGRERWSEHRSAQPDIAELVIVIRIIARCFIEHFLCARHLGCVPSLNPQEKPKRKDL